MKKFRFIKRIAAVLTTAAMLFSTPAAFAKEPAPAPAKQGKLAPLSESDSLCSYEEWGILYLTNKLRMSEGLAPLSTYDKLQNAANVRKNELVQAFSHTRPNGSGFFTAIQEAGTDYTAAGENIASGYSSPADAILSWWNSPGHKSNILGPNFTHMAPGYNANGYNWLQLFTGNCTPNKISVIGADDYYYYLPSDLSIDDGQFILAVECKHGTSYMPVMEEMCEGYDPSDERRIQSVTVRYQGLTTAFDLCPYPPMNFADVSPSDWYYDTVHYMYMTGIMTGLNDTYFGSAMPLARAQFALLLYRLMDQPEVTFTGKFLDIYENDWYADAVIWASQAGIVTGYTNGNFGPGDNINREQMALMMYRYAKHCGLDTSMTGEISGFKDAHMVDSFAKEAMEWAVGSGIISGKYNGTMLEPHGYASRAECATIITRFLNTYFN